MNKRTYQIILGLSLIGVLIAGIFTYQSYSKYLTTKENYTAAKKSFDAGNKKYLDNKEVYENGKKEYEDTKSELANIEKEVKTTSEQINTDLQTYLDNANATVNLIPTLVEKLSEMEAPEGMVFRPADGSSISEPILAHKNPTLEQAKSEWPKEWAESVEIGKIINTVISSSDNAILGRVKNLIAIGRPYQDNEWPEILNSPDRMRTFFIGSGIYDSSLKTNFSGMSPDNKYADARDNKVKDQGPSKEEALKWVKERDKNDPDLAYNDAGVHMGKDGNYRLIKVSSKSMQAQGGSGSLGFLRVYSDGTIKEGQEDD